MNEPGYMKSKIRYTSISTRPVATKLDRMGAMNLTVTCSFLHVVTQIHLTNKKGYISTSVRPYSTKLEMVVVNEKI